MEVIERKGLCAKRYLYDIITKFRRKNPRASIPATALREWQPLAEQGNHSAQFFLGVCYANGYGIPKNLELALQWYRLSSDQGNWLAQNDLGVMYQNGDGVVHDYEEAAHLYRLGAEKGYMVAQSNLAAMYYLW